MKIKDSAVYIQQRKPFSAGNLYSVTEEGTYIIYSYGNHWPLAVYKPAIGWLLNETPSSASTNRHRGHVARSLTQGYDKSNVAYLRSMIGEL